MNAFQRSARDLAKREMEIWSSEYVLLVIALTVATGLASAAIWMVLQWIS